MYGGFFGLLTSKVFLFLGGGLVQIIAFVSECFGRHMDLNLWVMIPLILSLLILILMMYGTLFGKYNFKVERLTITLQNLPSEFDGFRLLQLSDIHSGTWDSIKGVEKGINMVIEEAADVVLFTGDLVNTSKEEINPFIELFAKVDPPFGKYAVLGNHDYYGQPRDGSKRQEYYDDFFSKYVRMGFDLILNDSRKIKKGDDLIQLIGVENWGNGRFFPKRGDLSLATANCTDGLTTILLSHDPTHWEEKALQFPFHFDLTLSGHTHGMQFGINLPFLKWSPVQFRYKRWMGLYKEMNQYLYVNRGFGLLAFPGRVGMTPEITVITLKKG